MQVHSCRKASRNTFQKRNYFLSRIQLSTYNRLYYNCLNFKFHMSGVDRKVSKLETPEEIQKYINDRKKWVYITLAY